MSLEYLKQSPFVIVYNSFYALLNFDLAFFIGYSIMGDRRWLRLQRIILLGLWLYNFKRLIFMKVFLSHHKSWSDSKSFPLNYAKAVDQIVLVSLNMPTIPLGSPNFCQRTFLLF